MNFQWIHIITLRIWKTLIRKHITAYPWAHKQQAQYIIFYPSILLSLSYRDTSNNNNKKTESKLCPIPAAPSNYIGYL